MSIPGAKLPEIHPQAAVSRFWGRYHSKNPGRITSIFPKKLYKDLAPYSETSRSKVQNAAHSYDAARAECLEMVRNAVAMCERTNTRFSDPEFDIENDFYCKEYNCINGLEKSNYEVSYESDLDDIRPYTSPHDLKTSVKTILDSGVLGSNSAVVDLGAVERFLGKADEDPTERPDTKPGSVHRLDWIFESPQFTVNGFSGTDIKQGSAGDCWWLAAVATIAHRKDIMEKVCVARDEECGVYGFVFYRDGEWVPTVVDDNLYLSQADFGQSSDVYDVTGKKGRKYRKEKQTGSESLYYGQCIDENETWLPLLEKAYAKVHGDYDAISGGWAGSGIEDLTGGVNTVIQGARVLRKDRLWRELVSSDRDDCEFVFGLSAMMEASASRKNGIILSHAYSILKATEVEDEDGKKHRLVKIRNPWGRRCSRGYGEWSGPWSDGSKEWTPFMIKRLGHEFADNGVFWMLFDDVLGNFKWVHRTRLFDSRWTIAQQWMSSPVSWVSGYLKRSFTIEVKQEGPVVIVLAQLDNRYFKGLDGQYRYYLDFLLRPEGSNTPLLEAKGFHSTDKRSVNCEIYLQPGRYEVFPKVTADKRDWIKPIEQVIKNYAQNNPAKLRQVGLQYDRANAKVGVLDEDTAQDEKRAKLKAKKKRDKVKQSKIKEMSDAMEKLQVAMAGAREEIDKRMSKLESGPCSSMMAEPSCRQEEDRTEINEPDVMDMSPQLPGVWPEEPANPAAPAPPRTNASAKDSNTQNTTTNEATSDFSAPTSTSNAEVGKEVPAPEPTPVPNPPPPPGPVPVDEMKAVPPPPPDSDDEDSDSDYGEDDEVSKRKPTWNPVCVMCVRVYAQDKDVRVWLAEDEAPASKGTESPVMVDASEVPAAP